MRGLSALAGNRLHETAKDRKAAAHNAEPLIQTPAFPEYTSGHAAISRSVAEILTGYFGEDFAFTDSSQQVFGLGKRSFSSFRQAAAEAGISRVYGGIHYRKSYNVGAWQGEQLGKHMVKTLDVKQVKK